MTDHTRVALAEARDERRYRIVLVAGTALALGVFALGAAALQATLLQAADFSIPIGARGIANFAGVILILIGTWTIPVQRMSWPARVAALTGVCVAAAVLRAWLQVILHVHGARQFAVLAFDAGPAAVTTAFSLGVGLALAEYEHLVIRRGRESARQALLAATALDALRDEEMRVRREVAEGLHGTVQQQLILLAARLRRASQQLAQPHPDETAAAASEVGHIAEDLDRLRERDVRDLSRVLYPSGIDVGLVQAGRILIRQIPATIEVTSSFDESVLAADDPQTGGISLELRLVAIRVIEEGVSNAIRHGQAARLAIAMQVDDARVLSIVIDDNGGGIGSAGISSGLRLLTESLARRGGSLSLTDGPLGGARLSAQLPLAA